MSQFYSRLYFSQAPSREAIHAYLQDIAPKMRLSENHRALLEMDITNKEIASVTGEIHLNKAPGDDNFSLNFYKAYKHLLVPKLLSLFIQIVKDRVVPGSWKRSNTITVLKPDKDPSMSSSY